MENNLLNIPKQRTVNGIKEEVPFFFVGDKIFSLKQWFLRPYPGPLDYSKKIFNYRLSRARRTIENAFGILVARWRIFRRPIRADVRTVELITQASLCLHNYLRLTNSATYTPHGFVDSELANGKIVEGGWRREDFSSSALIDFPKAKGGKVNHDAKELQ